MNKSLKIKIEFISLYILMPIILTLIGNPMLPFLILALVGYGYYFSHKKLINKYKKEFNFSTLKTQLKSILLNTLIVFVILFIFTYLFYPQSLFSLQKENPYFLIAIFFIYGIISVFPQTIMYRFMFEHKFSNLITNNNLRFYLAIIIFSFGHIIFLNWIALVFTLIGGYVFYRRYLNSQSFWASYLEHLLLGYMVFFIGLGQNFV